jgi:cytochrome c553
MSCEAKKTKRQIKIVDKIPASFRMYKTSEMASLMRLMYAENMQVRKQIIEGKEITDFNKEYLKIHTAKLTDVSDLDATFATFATFFIETQKNLNQVSKDAQKSEFNKIVAACIACHKDRCTGPIPRIKKLIIL